MKSNKFIILFLLLLAVGVAKAQPRIAREVHLGALGGVVLSNYNFSPTVTQDMARGYTFGLAARYIEEKYFGLQTEFLITRRGIKDRFDEYPDWNFQRNLTYIEVPVLAHVYFNCGQKSEIAFNIGPKLGFFMSDATETNLNDTYKDEFDVYKANTSHGYAHHDIAVSKKFDYGLQAGLGYEFKINKSLSLQLEGRYYFGLGNMFPDEKSDVFENSNNHHIQIVAALWFRSQIAKYKIHKKLRELNKKK